MVPDLAPRGYVTRMHDWARIKDFWAFFRQQGFDRPRLAEEFGQGVIAFDGIVVYDGKEFGHARILADLDSIRPDEFSPDRCLRVDLRFEKPSEFAPEGWKSHPAYLL